MSRSLSTGLTLEEGRDSSPSFQKWQQDSLRPPCPSRRLEPTVRVCAWFPRSVTTSDAIAGGAFCPDFTGSREHSVEGAKGQLWDFLPLLLSATGQPGTSSPQLALPDPSGWPPLFLQSLVCQVGRCQAQAAWHRWTLSLPVDFFFGLKFSLVFSCWVFKCFGYFFLLISRIKMTV